MKRQWLGVTACFIGTLTLAAVLSLSIDRIGTFFGLESSAEATAQTLQGLETEKQNLLSETQEFASSQTFLAALKEEDMLELLSLATEQGNFRNLDNLIITDAQGITLARTPNATRRGDYMFGTSPWGQRVGSGETLVAIEQALSQGLLHLFAGLPVSDNGELVGSVFAVTQITPGYLQEFRNTHLNPGTEIAAYSTTYGLVGSSFDNPAVNEVLSAIFAVDSGFAPTSNSQWAERVKIADKYYWANNIPLQGVEGNPIGDIIILTPAEPEVTAILVAALFAFLFFIGGIVLAKRLIPRRDEDKFNVILAILAVLMFGLVFAIHYHQLQRASTVLVKSPYAIYNATMSFSPEYRVFDPAFEQQVDIMVIPGGEAINAVQATVEFDPAIVQVVGIRTDKSICEPEYFVEQVIDPAGKVKISCVVLNPGYTGSRGILATLVLQPLQVGTSALRFATGTQVLANDGLGTNVLRKTTNGSYRIKQEPTEGEANILTIYSFSHPNSERWYPSRKVQFSWLGTKGATYQYAINNQPDYLPSLELSTSENSAALEVPKDGIYYIHLLRTYNGVQSVDHQKIMVDTTPPPLPTVLFSESTVKKGDILRLHLENTDPQPSYQSGFYVSLNDGIFLPVQTPVYLPFVASGDYTVTVRTFDTAGNYSDLVSELNVE